MAAVQLGDTTLFSDANLQEYYTLEDANADKNANNLTEENTPTYVSAKFTNGVSGGTTDGNKALTIASSLGFGSGDYSISLWLKLNTEIAAGLYYICEIASATANNSVLLQYDYNSGTPQLSVQRVRLGVAADTGTPYNITLGTSAFYHIVWTYNNTSNTMKLYVNNVEVQSFTSSGDGSGGGTDRFRLLAGRNNATDNNTLGIIDDVGLFNRVLTTTDIDLLYNGLPSTSGGSFLLHFT